MTSDRMINIFISYSHKNEAEKERFIKFLRAVDILDLDIWTDDRIEPGTEFEPEITSAIEKADIAILLVSVDFLNSNFIKGKEIPPILEKQAKQRLQLFPIIIRACSWRNVEWLAKKNVRPKNGDPIFGSRNTDKALEKITDEIVAMARKILKKENSAHRPQDSKNGRPPNADIPDKVISQKTILPFANRAEILAKLDPEETKRVFKNFVAIDGPAGRGKTELIKELYRRYKNANWDSAFGVATLASDNTYENRKRFVRQLAENLDINNWNPSSNDYGDLGGQLFVRYESIKANDLVSPNGLAFFIDWDGEIEQNELNELINGFVVRIREKAQENDSFASDQRKLLFIIAGRYVLSFDAFSRSKIAFNRISLLPFVYEDVQDVLYQHLNKSRPSSKVMLLSSFVLFLSGGHPGLMAKIIAQYEEENHYPIPSFVEKYIGGQWAIDINTTVKEITRGVFERNPDLLDIAKEFCVFRYFNATIAETILSKINLVESQKQAYKLSIMKSLGLYQHGGSLYYDGLVSTLLALSLSVENNQKFQEQCNNAKELCLQELKDDFLHHKWFLEYLYISLLQLSVESDWQSKEKRAEIRKRFRSDLEHLLIAVKNLSDQKTGRASALVNMIEQELDGYKSGNDSVKANFRFLSNYVLGESTYRESFFEESFIPQILTDIHDILGLGD